MSNYTRDLKIILLFLILVFALSGVLTPRLFNPFGNKIIYANLASAGVLFSAGIVHLLGEAAPTVNKALPGDDYPWGYLFCGISFYFIFCSERLVIHAMMHKQRLHRHSLSRKHSIHEHKHHQHNHQHKHCANAGVVCTTKQKIEPEMTPNVRVIEKSSQEYDSHAHISTSSNVEIQRVPASSPEASKAAVENIGREESMSQMSHMSNGDSDTCNDCECEEDAGHHHGTDIVTLLDKQNFMAAFILLFGLGLHSILAGFALGASQDSKTVFSLGIAIIAHKYLEAFALGCPLYKSKLPLYTFIGVAVFYSLLTPVGMAIGWIAGQDFEGYVGSIFVCLTAGTFIYVSVCEIMIPEFSHDHSLLMHEKEDTLYHECRKMMAVLVGFGFMSMLAVWV